MSAIGCRFVVAVAVVVAGQVMAVAADITPPSEKQAPHNTVLRLTGAIETIGEIRPDDASSDAPLAFAFPESVPPPPVVGCRYPIPAALQVFLEDVIEQFDQEGTLLPIERHVEYFGVPAAPRPNAFRYRGPHPDPRTFAAAVRHFKKCDQAICEHFYALFPSLPQMPSEWSVPISEQIKERLDSAASLQLAGMDDCSMSSGNARPQTPIEQFLARDLLPVDLPEDIGLPGYRTYPPTYQSGPGRNWVIAGSDGGNALVERHPDIGNHLAN